MAAVGARVLDLGCGSGHPIATYLAKQGCRITGVDGSPAMIALCRERLPDQTWRLADMRGLDLGERFDGLLAWDSFFHLSRGDQRAMFEVFARHASAGAPLLFTSGPAEGEAIGEYAGEPLYHASLSEAEYRRLLSEYGFDEVDHEVGDLAAGGHTVWLAVRRDGS